MNGSGPFPGKRRKIAPFAIPEHPGESAAREALFFCCRPVFGSDRGAAQASDSGHLAPATMKRLLKEFAGMAAVALENGLIVPVVKGAGEKNTLGLSRAIQDVADRARAKKLNPEEVHGGTFTITNPGNFGAQFGLPIINQPQVAILGVGTIEKRVIVVDDAIAIRTMGYLTLGYDHRLVDGAVADQFMADVKKGIENFDPAQL